jgi:hypothetical protein
MRRQGHHQDIRRDQVRMKVPNRIRDTADPQNHVSKLPTTTLRAGWRGGSRTARGGMVDVPLDRVAADDVLAGLPARECRW